MLRTSAYTGQVACTDAHLPPTARSQTTTLQLRAWALALALGAADPDADPVHAGWGSRTGISDSVHYVKPARQTPPREYRYRAMRPAPPVAATLARLAAEMHRNAPRSACAGARPPRCAHTKG